MGGCQGSADESSFDGEMAGLRVRPFKAEGPEARAFAANLAASNWFHLLLETGHWFRAVS